MITIRIDVVVQEGSNQYIEVVGPIEIEATTMEGLLESIEDRIQMAMENTGVGIR